MKAERQRGRSAGGRQPAQAAQVSEASRHPAGRPGASARLCGVGRVEGGHPARPQSPEGRSLPALRDWHVLGAWWLLWASSISPSCAGLLPLVLPVAVLPQDPSKGGAVETGCSGFHYIIYYFVT